MPETPETVDTDASHRLGFGCSNLGSDLSYRASCSLIETAFDAGFRYFDVAPSYGHGQAERILGDVLQGVRDEVTLVTKVGIAHPRRVNALLALKRAAAPIKRLLPGLWSHGAQQTRRATAPGGQFGAKDITASIEMSLTRLRTASIDWLLLHEVRPNELTAESLLVLQQAVAIGHVRGLGLGTSVHDTQTTLVQYPGIFGLVQMNHFWGAFSWHPGETPLLVTHRAIRDGMAIVNEEGFRHSLEVQPAYAILLDAIKSNVIAADLLLAAALQRRVARVLVGSSRPDRVRQFMHVARSDSWSSLAAQLNSALESYRKAITERHETAFEKA
ncbi:MAG: aldo/keto reductase [Rhodoferax sp.]|nr:aldo/keto reductase [Rhodoferax sp.]